MLDQLRLRVLRIHAGRDPEVDACARLVRHGGGRADDRRAVDAKHCRRRSRPQGVRDLVAADDVDAVEHACVLAELLRRVRGSRPRPRAVEPADRRRALVVAQRRQHADQRRERVRRRAAEHARVHGTAERPHGHPDPAIPEGSWSGSACRPTLPVSQTRMASARSSSGFSRVKFSTRRFPAPRTLADDLHVHRQRSAPALAGRRGAPPGSPCSRPPLGRTSGRSSRSAATGDSQPSSEAGWTSWWK